MSPAQANRLLGIKPGTDIAAVRKAYAAKLKALDVDADPLAYAALRQARDLALRLTKEALTDEAIMPQAEVRTTACEREAGPVGHWPYGAPLRPDLANLEIPFIKVGDYSVTAPSKIALEPIELQQTEFQPTVELAFAGPPRLSLDRDGASGGVARDRPDRDLYTLLNSGGDSPLGQAELDRAQDWLDQILADAATADLNASAHIEGWLADTVAQAWPRSAPLLPTVAAAFGWENERGQLHERPSIAWLNARLRGYRFQNAVVDPAHRFHKAWVELHRPGRSTVFSRSLVKREPVTKLLAGVREHFPELEEHFDPQRVASWETPGASVSMFSRMGLGVAVALLLQLGRLIPDAATNSPHADAEGLYGPPAVVAPADPEFEPIRDAAIVAAFGEGKTIEWLREKQASLASSLETQIHAYRSGGATADATVRLVEEFVHRVVFLAGRRETGLNLDDTMSVHLAYLDAAREQGPAKCAVALNLLDFRDVNVPQAVHDKETRLAARLAEAGKLAKTFDRAPAQARVPGELVEKVLQSTRLSQKQVEEGLSARGSPGNICAVKRELLRAALKWHGPERDRIFLTI